MLCFRLCTFCSTWHSHCKWPWCPTHTKSCTWTTATDSQIERAEGCCSLETFGLHFFIERMAPEMGGSVAFHTWRCPTSQAGTHRLGGMPIRQLDVHSSSFRCASFATQHLANHKCRYVETMMADICDIERGPHHAVLDNIGIHAVTGYSMGRARARTSMITTSGLGASAAPWGRRNRVVYKGVVGIWPRKGKNTRILEEGGSMR